MKEQFTKWVSELSICKLQDDGNELNEIIALDQSMFRALLTENGKDRKSVRNGHPQCSEVSSQNVKSFHWKVSRKERFYHQNVSPKTFNPKVSSISWSVSAPRTSMNHKWSFVVEHTILKVNFSSIYFYNKFSLFHLVCQSGLSLAAKLWLLKFSC